MFGRALRNCPKTTLVLTLMSIFLLIYSITKGIDNGIAENRFLKTSWIFFDEKFIPMMKDISKTVPKNQPIMMIPWISESSYFIDHTLMHSQPNTTSKSLENFMQQKNIQYLLLFDNYSMVQEDRPRPITLNDMKNLTEYFNSIKNYTTANQFKFHLFQLLESKKSE